MEEKRYPNLEEESNSHMASEPAAAGTSVASTSADGITAVHDWIDRCFVWCYTKVVMMKIIRSARLCRLAKQRTDPMIR